MEQQRKPTISIDPVKSRIRVYKETLHLLGDPDYIQLLINPQSESIALRVSRKEDHLAHKIKWSELHGRKSYEIYSSSLTENLHTMNKNIGNSFSSKIVGKLYKKDGVACFSLNEAVPIEKVTPEVVANE